MKQARGARLVFYMAMTDFALNLLCAMIAAVNFDPLPPQPPDPAPTPKPIQLSLQVCVGVDRVVVRETEPPGASMTIAIPSQPHREEQLNRDIRVLRELFERRLNEHDGSVEVDFIRGRWVSVQYADQVYDVIRAKATAPFDGCPLVETCE